MKTEQSRGLESGIAACTIISKNYLAFARVLAESFLKYHPECEFYVLLVDRLDGYFEPSKEKFKLFTIDELDIPDKDRFYFQYRLIELNTAVKPYFLEHIFKTHPVAKLLYFDPDILILKPVSELYNLLEANNIILTPHITAPIKDDYRPNEVDVLQVGTNNLGFMGIRKNAQTVALLEWMKERLYDKCRVALERGLFIDQKWAELIPSLCGEVSVFRHPGYNLAYWNLMSRKVERRDNEYFVNAEPLHFFHFSGMDLYDLDKVSRYQNRFTLDMLENLRPLFENYRDRVLRAGYEESRNWPYAFARFSNNVVINDEDRYLYLEMGEKAKKFGNPFDACAQPSYFAWLERQKKARLIHADRVLKAINLLYGTLPFALRRLLNELLEFSLVLFRRLLGKTAYNKALKAMKNNLSIPQVATFTKGTSETSKCRHRLAKFCKGYGLDIGYGGDPIVPSAITVDLPVPYTTVGDSSLALGGDARDLKWFKDGVLDYVYSSHLLEDFTDTKTVLLEWIRVLKTGGHLVLYLPDEKIYRRHCERTGQQYNAYHKIEHFSLEYIKETIKDIKNIKIIHEKSRVEEYSFEIVMEKI